jgi:hypothetical protein
MFSSNKDRGARFERFVRAIARSSAGNTPPPHSPPHETKMPRISSCQCALSSRPSCIRPCLRRTKQVGKGRKMPMTLRYDLVSQISNLSNFKSFITYLLHIAAYSNHDLCLFTFFCAGVDQQQNRPAFWASFIPKAETGKSGEDQCQQCYRYDDLCLYRC